MRVRDTDRPELDIKVELSKDTFYNGDMVTGEISITGSSEFTVEPTFDFRSDFMVSTVYKPGNKAGLDGKGTFSF